MAEMLLAKDHDVIEAVLADRSDQPSASPFARQIEPKSGDPVWPSL
jgi:hypothetical protein